MKAHWQYLKYVMRHKWFVFWAGLELGVPLLILLLHDWDKFMPDEWGAYVRTFYAPDGTKQYKPGPAFAAAWKAHQKRNKHHYQYWIKFNPTILPYIVHNADVCRCHDVTPIWTRTHLDHYIYIRDINVIVWDKGNADCLTCGKQFPTEALTCDPMPDVYVREMLADWRGAGAALGLPDTRAWYEKSKGGLYLHPDTRAWIEFNLNMQEVKHA